MEKRQFKEKQDGRLAPAYFSSEYIFWSTFANSKKWDYCLKSSFRRFSTNINSTNDFDILWKDTLSRLFLQNFCLTVPKNFVGEHISVSENLEYRKRFLHEKGISRFCVENFLSHSTEKLRRRPLLCLKKSLYWKFSCIGGGHHGFVENFLSHRTEKLRKASLLFHKTSGIEKIYGLEGGSISIFWPKFIVSQCRKIS